MIGCLKIQWQNVIVILKSYHEAIFNWPQTLLRNISLSERGYRGIFMTKTATDLKRAGWPRDELIKYRPWQAMERHKRDQDLISHRDRALSVAREAAVILKEQFGANCVVSFGSLAQGAWIKPRSDIDLCVDGIPFEHFFRAEAEIEAITSGFKVDLLDFRECSPELLKRIDREGIEL